MVVDRRPHVNVYTRLLSVGIILLGLSALGWVAMQWHEHLHKIDVERLTPELRSECSESASLAVMMAKQGNREGRYSQDDDAYYKASYQDCVETHPVTAEAIHSMERVNFAYAARLAEGDKPSKNK